MFLIMKIRIVLLSFFFFFKSYCQTTISGTISDERGNAISFANIVIKETINNKIIAYTYSDKKGHYSLQFITKNDFNVIFSSLGYENKTVLIRINEIKKETKIDATLKEHYFELEEVTVRTELPISIRKDTVSFKTKFYVKGNENTVEDLLDLIPGLYVDDEGTIKIGNQEIEKLMIDNDDFFGKNYKILSKNMPAYPIEEVEIIKNYSNDRLLKGIKDSNKVAINLKLNKKLKRVWFGNTQIGYGNDNLYELKANVMNFGEKNKLYFLTNLNNIGNDATGEINRFFRSYNLDETANVGNNQHANNLIKLSERPFNFKKNRTNFNNAKLLSINAILNPTNKLKIKIFDLINWDKKSFYRNSTNKVYVNEINFSNTESLETLKNKTIGLGKIDIIYNISKTKILKSTTQYSNRKTNTQSNLIFNGASTLENLNTKKPLFDQKVTYSNRIDDDKIILITGRIIKEKIPESYHVNQFFFQDLFPDYLNANNVRQQLKNQMQFAGFEAHLFDKKANKNLLELQLGYTSREDMLKTRFSLYENTIALDQLNDFLNNTIYQSNDLYFKTKYDIKLNDFGINFKLGFHQLFNNIKFSDYSQNQNPFLIIPKISFNWKINDKNNIISSYSYNTTNPRILDLYSNYVLTGSHSFSKGIGAINQLNASTLLFSYQLGNWSDRFFANTFVIYNKNFDFFSNNTLINQNFTQSNKILIKDTEMLNVSSKIDYYLKKISSNIKLDIGYLKSNYKNKINNHNLREVIINNYNYGLELRSGYKGFFNYHFGSKWYTNKIVTSTVTNSFTNNVSFLDLSFIFNKKFDVLLQTEQYLYGNLDKANNTYYFLDFNTKYTLKKNKLTVGIFGKNLFNTKTFRTFSISDIGTSSTEYKLLNRSVLLKLEYRF